VPEGFSSAALPAQLASRQWIDLRPGLDQASVLVNAISGFQAPAPAEAQPPVTPSVERAASLLGDDAFTAAALVAAVLQIHPEYGERKGGSVELDVQTGEEMPASA
jgi:hypothetical protein